MIRIEGQEGSVKFLFDPIGDIVKLHVQNIDTGQVETKMDEMINAVKEG